MNTWGTLGAIGATTGVMPAMTLAPGGIGGAVVSDNITVTHLLNVKRLAYALHEPPAGGVPARSRRAGRAARGGPRGGTRRRGPGCRAPAGDDRVDRIVQRVLQELGGGP